MAHQLDSLKKNLNFFLQKAGFDKSLDKKSFQQGLAEALTSRKRASLLYPSFIDAVKGRKSVLIQRFPKKEELKVSKVELYPEKNELDIDFPEIGFGKGRENNGESLFSDSASEKGKKVKLFSKIIVGNKRRRSFDANEFNKDNLLIAGMLMIRENQIKDLQGFKYFVRNTVKNSLNNPNINEQYRNDSEINESFSKLKGITVGIKKRSSSMSLFTNKKTETLKMPSLDTLVVRKYKNKLLIDPEMAKDACNHNSNMKNLMNLDEDIPENWNPNFATTGQTLLNTFFSQNSSEPSSNHSKNPSGFSDPPNTSRDLPTKHLIITLKTNKPEETPPKLPLQAPIAQLKKHPPLQRYQTRLSVQNSNFLQVPRTNTVTKLGNSFRSNTKSNDTFTISEKSIEIKKKPIKKHSKTKNTHHQKTIAARDFHQKDNKFIENFAKLVLKLIGELQGGAEASHPLLPISQASINRKGFFQAIAETITGKTFVKPFETLNNNYEDHNVSSILKSLFQDKEIVPETFTLQFKRQESKQKWQPSNDFPLVYEEFDADARRRFELKQRFLRGSQSATRLSFNSSLKIAEANEDFPSQTKLSFKLRQNPEKIKKEIRRLHLLRSSTEKRMHLRSSSTHLRCKTPQKLL